MAIAIILVLIVAASLLFHFLSPWQATPVASNWASIDTTLFITLVITGLFFVAVTLFMALAVWRFRHRVGRRAAYQPESKKLEGWLMLITTLGIVGLLAPGLVIYNDFVQVPDDAHEVEVLAQQWQWGFRFPGADGRLGRSDVRLVEANNPFGLDPADPLGQDDVLVRSNRLHLPLDRPVKVLLRSKDVLHNFYIPQMRAKMDMVPGMVAHFWFTPTRTGEFEILCAEYCGVGHFNMRGKLQVDSQADFETWLGAQPTFAQTLAAEARPGRDSLVEQGRQLAESNGCLACHSLDGSASLGPTWKGLYGSARELADGSRVEADDAYLKESILQPQARLVAGYPPVMVAYRFDDQQLEALIALIRSLSDAAPAEQAPSAEQSAARGRQLAESMGCLACHSLDGSPGLGPGWQGLYGSLETLADGSQVRVDEAYLKASILTPNSQIVRGYAAMMPAYTPSDEELQALIASIKSLADGAAAAGQAESGEAP